MIARHLVSFLRPRFIVAVAFTISSVIAPFAAIAAGSRPDHLITIQSSDSLILAPKENKAWYEQGIWPVVGAALTLIITNCITVSVVYLQSSRSFNALLRQRKIERYADSLNDFYNPLLALMDMNKEIFEKTGPPQLSSRRKSSKCSWISVGADQKEDTCE